MNNSLLHVLLADDDEDDRDLFQEALDELPDATLLTKVKDGVELMQWLAKQKPGLPDLLFLDLNMPRKNGYQCLAEIKQDPDLRSLPVIVLSTGINDKEMDELYAIGAWHYIQKPDSYGHLTKIIEQVFRLSQDTIQTQPPKSDFVLYPKSYFNRYR